MASINKRWSCIYDCVGSKLTQLVNQRKRLFMVLGACNLSIRNSSHTCSTKTEAVPIGYLSNSNAFKHRTCIVHITACVFTYLHCSYYMLQFMLTYAISTPL